MSLDSERTVPCEFTDDNKFVDCAIAANARFIVTEDHHFNMLKEIGFPSVDVINIDDFLKEVRLRGDGSE